MTAKELVIYSCILVGLARAYENEFGPTYGKEWILYKDDQNDTHLVYVPSSTQDSRAVQIQQIYYHLYTRRNEEPEELSVPTENNTFSSKYFNASNILKVVTHGWFGSGEDDWIHNITDAYLRKGDYNVLTVDWNSRASNFFYPSAAKDTEYVGRDLAKLLDAISDKYKINGSRMHLIGHSLGAHVVGFAGSYSQQNVSRITGLDPARPYFELPLQSPEYRLDKSDAELVDIIHTCGGIYGYIDSWGDADFYPNNGRPIQPGCSGLQQIIHSCSHNRAVSIFIESIESTIPFEAFPCESWEKFEKEECKDNPVLMGEPLSNNARGNFYLYTNSKPKFARGLNTTNPENDSITDIISAH